MNDLINRQDAIDAVYDAFCYAYCDNCEKEMNEDLCGDCHRKYQNWSASKKIIEKVINNLPSAQRWIPCSERMPEVNGRYLVTRGLNACGAMWNRVYLINYSDLMGLKTEKIWWNGNVGKSDFEHIDDVLAWMPLPEPYREKTASQARRELYSRGDET